MDGPDMTEYHRLSKSFIEMWKREELKDKDFITEGYRAHSEIIDWVEGELSDINKENAELKEKLLVAVDGISKLIPVVEEAFWDHSSAGNFPGAGYNHKCYSKLPFNWRQGDEFSKWIEALKKLKGGEGNEII